MSIGRDKRDTGDGCSREKENKTRKKYNTHDDHIQETRQDYVYSPGEGPGSAMGRYG